MGGGRILEHGFSEVDAGFCPKVCAFSVVLGWWGAAVWFALGGESQSFRNYVENLTFTLLFGPILRGSLRTTTFLGLRDRKSVGLCSIDTHGALIAHLAFVCLILKGVLRSVLLRSCVFWSFGIAASFF